MPEPLSPLAAAAASGRRTHPQGAGIPKARLAAAAGALLALAGCGGSDRTELGAGDYQVNVLPPFARVISDIAYDGSSDDLLTGGLGKTGLGSPVPPALSATPTAAELRRLAIHTNYRAIVDASVNGGYGTLYGPNVGADGVAGSGEGRIAGREIIAVADDGSGRQNVTMMVQVPSNFSAAAPCIVTGTSSGSRGVYGAIGSSGEWGLKRGCAVAYTDKGTGTGVHDLQADTVNAIDGRRLGAAAAGADANFTARLTAAEQAAFNAATPNRFAVKHAHSEQNPEKDWGLHTLQAVEFAFWALNQQFGAALPDGQRTRVITPANTLVIASSVSNGAGSALAAAEQDTAGWIDGVAVTEPNIQIAPGGSLRIERGTLPAYTAGSRPLFDVFSYANLLQPCAALSASVAAAPLGFNAGTAFVAGNRCAALAAAGLVTGSTTAERADDALARLRAYGWEPEADLLHASHYQFATPAIAVTYANTYGRFRVSDNLCGFSFAAVDAAGAPTAASAAALAGSFGTGNGVPPTLGLQIIYNQALGGAVNHFVGGSASTGALDLSYDGAKCLRDLWTGSGDNASRVQSGIAETYRSANLRGKPTLIVHGRDDTLVPTNFSSRPYVARNAQVEGAASRLRYIEVTNAQHFDAFLAFPGYDTRYVPLHLYYIRAMDAMWAHLKDGSALPPSQLVRTTPRGGAPGAAPLLTAAQVPAIASTPAPADLITTTVSTSGVTLRIPD